MDNNLSVGRVVLLTYGIIASSSCINLFSNDLKNSIQNNRYVQHIMLFLLIITLMTMFGNPTSVHFVDNDEFNIILMSLLVYVWFILTTKLDISWNIGILVLLSMYFLYESGQINKYKIIENDNVLDKIKKKELIDSFNNIQKYVLTGIFGITLIGTAFYSNEKQVQYGGSFNYAKFFFD
jgi:hypothetical protein